jgi:hypothetical protein
LARRGLTLDNVLLLNLFADLLVLTYRSLKKSSSSFAERLLWERWNRCEGRRLSSGSKADHLAQECRVGALLQKRTKGDLVVDHRGDPRVRVACPTQPYSGSPRWPLTGPPAPDSWRSLRRAGQRPPTPFRSVADAKGSATGNSQVVSCCAHPPAKLTTARSMRRRALRGDRSTGIGGVVPLPKLSETQRGTCLRLCSIQTRGLCRYQR